MEIIHWMGGHHMGDETSIKIDVIDEGMLAVMTVIPMGFEQITFEKLKVALERAGVVYGINQDVLRDIIQYQKFGKPFEVAHGTPPQDGEDGYYEFLFETDVNVKPKILNDGSVDYKSMGEVPVVEAGQELVRYHKATAAVSGKNVYGAELVGRRGKELLALRGKGFEISEDKLLYKASLTGKVTYKHERLEVSNVLIIPGDVTIATGGVKFSGDVVIKGNVLSGAEVHANGNIEVNGSVEAATLVAGKNVVLKNGMQGNGKGTIQAGNDVSGKFFEQVDIKAKGKVSANAIMHCNVVSEEEIVVAGRFGIIVGGKLSAYRGIEATIIGNMNEVKTVLEAGTSRNIYSEMSSTDEKIRGIVEEIRKLKASEEKIASMLAKNPGNAEINEMKVSVMRSKIMKETELRDAEKEMSHIADIISKTSNPRITVLKSIYPGVWLTINGVTQKLKTENYNIHYQKNGVELEFVPNI